MNLCCHCRTSPLPPRLTPSAGAVPCQAVPGPAAREEAALPSLVGTKGSLQPRSAVLARAGPDSLSRRKGSQTDEGQKGKSQGTGIAGVITL